MSVAMVTAAVCHVKLTYMTRSVHVCLIKLWEMDSSNESHHHQAKLLAPLA